MKKNNKYIVSLVITLVIMIIVTILNFGDHRYIYGMVGTLILVSVIRELITKSKRLSE